MATPAQMTMTGPAPAQATSDGSKMTMAAPAPAPATAGGSRTTMAGPAPAAPVTCVVCPKSKEYRNKQGLSNHVKRMHQSAIDQVQKLATMLSPSPSLSSPVTSPHKRTLSFSGSQLSLDKEDVTEAPANTIVPEQTNNEADLELQQDEDGMEAAKEDIELYEALTDLADSAFDPETEKEKRDILKEKLLRYNTIMRKKENILKATLEEIKSLKLSEETLKHDVVCRTEVQKNQETLINQKENEVKEITKRFKNLEKITQKIKDENKINIDSLNETVGSLTKRNADLIIQLDAQTSLAESLAGEASPSERDVEVEVHDEEPIQRVDMSKETTGPKCNACNKPFKTGSDLDRHMQDKHEEHACNVCGTKFNSRKQSEEHICDEDPIVPQICDKSYCKKKYVSSNALAKHIKNSHFGHQRFVCNKCDEILDNNNGLKKHMETCSKEVSEKIMEVCKHWKKGKCHWGTQCRFSHVGHQDKTSPVEKSTNNARMACRNGLACSYLARGRCNFAHHMTKSHYSREHQGTRHNQSTGQGQMQNDNRHPCKFGRNCDQVPNCAFIHSLEDFPRYSQSQGVRASNPSGNNRN